MKKILFFALLLLSSQMTEAKQVTIQTKNMTMVLNVDEGKQPQYVYFGTKLSDYDLAHLQAPRNGRMEAYPAYGMNCPAEAALAMRHADGNLSTELVVSGMETKDDILRIFLKDPVYPVSVALCYKAYEDEDMIETWTETINEGKKPVTLTRFDSGHLPIRYDDVWISTLYGTWANEARVNSEPLTRGWKMIRNIDGARNSQTSHAEVMISLDGKPREDAGRVIGAALCWGGNYELRFQTNDSDYHHFFALINAKTL